MTNHSKQQKMDDRNNAQIEREQRQLAAYNRLMNERNNARKSAERHLGQNLDWDALPRLSFGKSRSKQSKKLTKSKKSKKLTKSKKSTKSKKLTKSRSKKSKSKKTL
uniref:Uncharacterized protein n=1 Tax=viral metagenome TaxID=1070528 RepID=A0A6C0KG49_9ZZZZ